MVELPFVYEHSLGGMIFSAAQPLVPGEFPDGFVVAKFECGHTTDEATFWQG